MAQRGIGRCALAAVLFGASAPAASRLAGDMSAFTLAGLLYLGAALAVVPFAGAHRPSRAEARRAAPRLAVAVVAGGAVAPVLLALGLQNASAATASLLLNLEVVFTVVLAAALFKEHLGGRVIVGSCLVVAAGVGLAWSGGAELRTGAFFVAVACLCWAVDNNVTAKLATRPSPDDTNIATRMSRWFTRTRTSPTSTTATNTRSPPSASWSVGLRGGS